MAQPARLSFLRRHRPGQGPDDLAPDDVVVPVIDDVPLHELVGKRFPGVSFELVAPPSRHWLGAPELEEGGRAVVLDGGCGIFECCGVACRIELGDDRVTWTDFFARGRPPLPDDLHFEFERSSYEAALRSIASLLPD